MSFADYQKQIDETVQDLEIHYWAPLSQLARLSEEVGEVARILNHKYGDKPKKPGEEHEDLADELADVIYTVLCIANSEGIALDKPMQNSIAKLKTRDAERFKKKQQN